ERVIDRIAAEGRGAALPPASPRGEGDPSLPLLSPSKWRVYAACPRKYWYDAVLRIPEWPRAEAAVADRAGRGGDGEAEVAARARLRGIVVHALLEGGRAAE